MKSKWDFINLSACTHEHIHVCLYLCTFLLIYILLFKLHFLVGSLEMSEVRIEYNSFIWKWPTKIACYFIAWWLHSHKMWYRTETCAVSGATSNSVRTSAVHDARALLFLQLCIGDCFLIREIIIFQRLFFPGNTALDELFTWGEIFFRVNLFSSSKFFY